MRIPLIVACGAAVFGLPIIGLGTYGEWVNAHLHYPGPDNESAFLRGYDPKAVVEQYMTPNEHLGESRGSGGGAGVKSVTHSARFGEYFTIQKSLKGSFILAVNRDISQRLVVNGAQILREDGSPSTGFHFDYKTGNTVGSIAILPLAPEPDNRSMPLPDLLEDVVLNIDVSETWFPKGIPLGVRSSEINVSYDVASR